MGYGDHSGEACTGAKPARCMSATPAIGGLYNHTHIMC